MEALRTPERVAGQFELTHYPELIRPPGWPVLHSWQPCGYPSKAAKTVEKANGCWVMPLQVSLAKP
jgi:hypothetical protein